MFGVQRKGGSSPLARGTLALEKATLDLNRFIPARAGNTYCSSVSSARWSVHPRSRGEHGAVGHRREGPRRFIPARAGNTWSRRAGRSPGPVHPRSRGEHLCTVCVSAETDGSSPLARGTLSGQSLDIAGERFIPARAGNTRGSSGSCAMPTVHPRSRGEHRPRKRHPRPFIGSSPLARGTHWSLGGSSIYPRFIPARAGNTGDSRCFATTPAVHPRSRGEHLGDIRRAVDEARFIPARAGNTPGAVRRFQWLPVHPRSRGEHELRIGNTPLYDGSSPLARGTPPRRRRRTGPGRFIPARAGNTEILCGQHGRMTVHPRSRGEHAVPPVVPSPFAGSSPLARGTLAPAGEPVDGARFIPARAGNTQPAPMSSARQAVHPRSRGEHTASARVAGAFSGSSPLARGTRAGGHVEPRLDRFIPARAGNTQGRPSPAGRRPVHPRSRGEHVASPSPTSWIRGSSPLARGTRYKEPRMHARGRFIPARAGNTASTSAGPRRSAVHPRSRGEHMDFQ